MFDSSHPRKHHTLPTSPSPDAPYRRFAGVLYLGLAIGAMACSQDVRIVDIAAGSGHSCDLDSRGRIRCWGENIPYVLGRTDITYSALPIRIEAPAAIAIAAGGDTSCALTDEGDVYCWGRNHHGQVGLPADDPDRVPTPTRIEGLPPVRALSVGFAHVCALSGEADVYCWGWNGLGQSDPALPGTHPAGPTRQTLEHPVIDVVAGYSATCALFDRGEAQCWGEDGLAPPGALQGQIHAMALGVNYACFAARDEVRCVGARPGDFFEALPSEGDAVIFSARTLSEGGIDHLCGIDAHGSARCWGKNTQGQLGDSSQRFAYTPSLVGGTERLEKIVVGAAHTCAIDRGQSVCWGDNQRGQLGDGSMLDALSPTPVVDTNDRTGEEE